ncbi:uncharacterized protein SAPINGB_P006375 [Magnusiomyces paraingens]|uniref:Uncharacterized protein n=1 Tax=Magnusiomyces paraingens TaxID=2606893 RepID=A0A5E8C6S2_9ASCO|nr:uncharacterized protein SAPINGB_P006375 [Saprochaete ingens]VVT58770.1 unnamed protein product [Saprochaete ingens]
METSDITPAELVLLRKLRVLQSRIDHRHHHHSNDQAPSTEPYSYARFCADLDVSDTYVLRLLDLLVCETESSARERGAAETEPRNPAKETRDEQVRQSQEHGTPGVYPADEVLDPRAAPAQYSARIHYEYETRRSEFGGNDWPSGGWQANDGYSAELDDEDQAYFLTRSPVPAGISDYSAVAGISPLLSAATLGTTGAVATTASVEGARATSAAAEADAAAAATTGGLKVQRKSSGNVQECGRGKVCMDSSARRVCGTRFGREGEEEELEEEAEADEEEEEEDLDQDTDLSAISLDQRSYSRQSSVATGSRKVSFSIAAGNQSPGPHSLLASPASINSPAALSLASFQLGSPHTRSYALPSSALSTSSIVRVATTVSSISSPDLWSPSLDSESPPDSPVITYYPGTAAAAATTTTTTTGNRPAASMASFLSQNQHRGTGAQGPYAEPVPYHRRGPSSFSSTSSSSVSSASASVSISASTSTATTAAAAATTTTATAVRSSTAARSAGHHNQHHTFGTSPGSLTTDTHPWIESNTYEQELVVSRRGSMWDAYDDPSLEGLVVQEINGVQLVEDV